MEQVSRPIGKDDLEFYEGVHVRAMAMIMARADETRWKAFPTKTRVRWLNKASALLVPFFNTRAVVEQLPRTLLSLEHRL